MNDLAEVLRRLFELLFGGPITPEFVETTAEQSTVDSTHPIFAPCPASSVNVSFDGSSQSPAGIRGIAEGCTTIVPGTIVSPRIELDNTTSSVHGAVFYSFGIPQNQLRAGRRYRVQTSVFFEGAFHLLSFETANNLFTSPEGRRAFGRASTFSLVEVFEGGERIAARGGGHQSNEVGPTNNVLFLVLATLNLEPVEFVASGADDVVIRVALGATASARGDGSHARIRAADDPDGDLRLGVIAVEVEAVSPFFVRSSRR